MDSKCVSSFFFSHTLAIKKPTHYKQRTNSHFYLHMAQLKLIQIFHTKTIEVNDNRSIPLLILISIATVYDPSLGSLGSN